jgi:hypothetical protein
LRGDVHGPVEQQFVRAHERRRSHDPAQQRTGVADRDELLPFRLRERTGDLAGEDGRCD